MSEEAIRRRIERAREAIEEANFHFGGGGHFESNLHPRARGGKFSHSFAADARKAAAKAAAARSSKPEGHAVQPVGDMLDPSALTHGRGKVGQVGYHNATHSIEEHNGRAMVYENSIPSIPKSRSASMGDVHGQSGFQRHIGDVPHAPAGMSTSERAVWYQKHLKKLTGSK